MNSKNVQSTGNMTGHNIVVFSGGSAANNLVDVFGSIAEGKSLS